MTYGNKLVMETNCSRINTDDYDSLLNQCADGCGASYCFFKMVIHEIHSSPRLLCQLKNIEVMKYEISEKVGHDIGINAAAEIWQTQGYAEAFSQVYEVGVPFREVYKRVITLVNQRKSSESK